MHEWGGGDTDPNWGKVELGTAGGWGGGGGGGIAHAFFRTPLKGNKTVLTYLKQR